MKHLRAKRIISIVCALLLLVALAAAYRHIAIMSDIQGIRKQIQHRAQSLMSSVSELMRSSQAAYVDYDKVLDANVKLCAVPLREDVRRDGDGAIRMYKHGFVLRVDGDEVTLPDGPGLPQVESGNFLDDEGKRADHGLFEATLPADADSENAEDGGADSPVSVLCMYERLYGNYYYVDLTREDELDDYVTAHVDLSAFMADLQETYGGFIVVFDALGNDFPLLYVPEEFTGQYDSALDMGIEPILSRNGSDIIELEGMRCVYALSEPRYIWGEEDGTNAQVALIVPIDNLDARQVPRLSWALCVSALFFITAITWVLSSIRLFQRSAVTEMQRKQYGVKRTRRTVAAIGIAGALAVLLVTLFVNSLTLLYNATQDNRSRLALLNTIATQARDNEQHAREQREDIYADFAERIAGLLADHSHLHNPEALEEMCGIVHADYLMIYDDKGREVMSNAPFVNLEFGHDSASDSYDFRKLLTGVSCIRHGVKVDRDTCLERQLIGVCLDDGDTSDGYGALIMALYPQKESDSMSLNDLMEALTPSDNLCMTLNPETGEILHASEPALIGENALNMGMTDRALADGFMDYITLEGTRWYSCSNLSEDALYHSATRANAIYPQLIWIALAFSGCFIVAYALLALVLLAGYTNKAIDELGAQVVEDEEALLHVAAATSKENDATLAVAMNHLRKVQIGQTPEKRTKFVFTLAGGLMLAAILIALQRGAGAREQFYILSYVLNGKWAPGVNLFAFAKIVLVSLIVTLILLALKLLTELASATLQKRGETICRLIYSFIQYGSVLGLIYCAFTYLGFDTRTLLASVGILSLALSLGAKDLVSDVLSGITIAFSDEYQIGDYIDIGGFRGWVEEIGVRTTTLVNNDGNIKNFSNRDVKNVLNLSRRNCCYTINVTIAYDQPLKKVEEILKRELPRIGEENAEIIKGPVYKGVSNLGAGGVTLSITTECKEQHYGKVRSRVNREIRLILEENGIVIK